MINYDCILYSTFIYCLVLEHLTPVYLVLEVLVKSQITAALMILVKTIKPCQYTM